MELVSEEKLEEVANFLTDIEVDGRFLCSYLNNSLKRNRIDVPCDVDLCEDTCPFSSKENFIRWLKKPESKIHVEDLEKPKQEDFIGFDNRSGSFALSIDYVQALEKYCNDLESVLADTEYDLESSECENRALLDKLEQIRGVIDGLH